jgi:hypothetical protein
VLSQATSSTSATRAGEHPAEEIEQELGIGDD